MLFLLVVQVVCILAIMKLALMEIRGGITLKTFALRATVITVVVLLINFFFGLGQGAAERMMNG